MTVGKETAPGKGMVADGLALSASAAITALAGMIGWVLAARLLPAAAVGDTSAFVSGFLLVAGIAELGLGPAVLRWLPRAGARRPRLLLRTYLAVLAGGVIGSVVFVLVPAGAEVVHRVPAGVAWFLVAGIGWTLFQFQDEVLTGLGLARWVPVENSAFSVARLGLLAGLGPLAGALGLVLSWAVPTLIGVAVVTFLIWRSVRRTSPALAPGELPGRREIVRLLAPSYPAMVCVVVLYNLVPLIVLHRFGAEANAVFFVVWTAINALDVAATAFVNPLVVRLSAEPGHARSLVAGAGKRLVLVFVPLLAVGAALAWVMLAIFGAEYTAGTDLLRVLLAAQVPRLVVVLGVAVHLAAGRGAGVAVLHAVTAVSAVVLALVVPTEFGFGVGMLVAQAVIAAAVLADLRRRVFGARP
ncbi:lipopolysaccharide biosynthesis protein [Amycolatopsis ruanii]|uniref:lipopolysaccharide biosynthesis protein n=1 Tax=Amycolatopsis ruanii TaxID=944491 RepID=UPI000E226404|nr:oligosaccharide flippase family protein [Amycolatopsis ruanii]